MEFLKKGPEGRELIIKKESVSDPANPTAPPVEVTRILTPEELAKENAGALQLNDTGEVVFESQCFGHGTDVWTAEGTTMEIQNCTPGCEVLARCEETGELAACRVLNLFEHEKVETYHVVYLDIEGRKDGVYTTAQHPFWVKGKGWTPVRELEPGQLLETRTGQVATISEVKKTGHSRTVYNLEVERFHTYFVGTLGVLVHNKNKTDT